MPSPPSDPKGPESPDSLTSKTPGPFKSYREILREEISQAEEELRRPSFGLFLSGMIAGIGISFSLLLIVGVMAADESAGSLQHRLALASAYSVGFILVILGRTDLFTEYTTIAILPVLIGKAKLRDLARLWGLVYAGNLIGGSLLVVAAVPLTPELRLASPDQFGILAADLTRPSPWVMLLSAVLAGWLMGLLSWLITAARDTVSQVVFVWLVAGTLGFTHLHHSVVGTLEVFAGFLAADAVTASGLASFLLWVTLGNALGGILFAVMIRFSVVVGKPE